MFDYRMVYYALETECKPESQQIQVRNCGGFYIYNLTPPSHLFAVCPRYCGMRGHESLSASTSAIQPAAPASRNAVTYLFSASPSTSSVQPTTSVSQNKVTGLFSASTSTSAIQPTTPVSKYTVTELLSASPPTLSVQPTTPVSKNTITELFSASRSTSSVQPTTPVSKNTDGCKAYKILSDNTRAVTYTGPSYQRCDANLYGWYRFKGDAGNRMLDYCPLSVRGSRHNQCGTAMQGWITSGWMPSQYEGEN